MVESASAYAKPGAFQEQCTPHAEPTKAPGRTADSTSERPPCSGGRPTAFKMMERLRHYDRVQRSPPRDPFERLGVKEIGASDRRVTLDVELLRPLRFVDVAVGFHADHYKPDASDPNSGSSHPSC